jgi:hypothetical protein
MCDCLVALAPATSGPFTLFAKNSDRPPQERQVIEWVSPRRDAAELRATHVSVHGSRDDTIGCLVSRPTWCWGVEHGVNEAGVAIGNETVYTTLDPREAPLGLTGLDLVRLGLERGATAAEAVERMLELLERHGQGGSGHDVTLVGKPRPYWSSFLVADPREAYVIETSGRTSAVERVTADGAVVRAISNRTTIPEFDRVHRHPRQPVARLVDPRLAASELVLSQRPVTVDSLVAHLRSHDSCVEEGWSVCMHVPDVEATTASMIAELRTDSAPHRAWMLLGHPCEQRYRELVVGRGALG